MDNRLIDALHCRNTGRPPVWFMRQAGRYMPEYRALKQKYSFQDLCFRPELIVEVTKMPIDLLGVDAAILFSDILIPLMAMGIDVVYEENTGPVLTPCIRSSAEMQKLHWDGFDKTFEGIPQAVKEISNTLSVPLLGFCGAPFTLASYLIEGKTSKELRFTKQWMMRDPESFNALLDLLVKVSAAYLNMQIEAGVKAVQIFDSWAQSLGPAHFQAYAVDKMQKVRELLPKHIPVIFFSRGGDKHAQMLAEARPDAVSADWTVDLPALRKRYPQKLAIQGNLDPAWLYAPKAELTKAAEELLSSMKGDPGYIFNLGHGIMQDVPLDSVKHLVRLIKG